jgi:phage terminase large subunit-like protein
LDGRDVFIGLDLSARTDLTSAVAIAMGDDGYVDVWPFFWTPEQGLVDRAKRDRQPYDVWVKQGFMLTTPGATVDYSFVAKQLSDTMIGANIVLVGFDRWRIEYFKKEMEALSVEMPMKEFGQGFKDMSPALDALESALLNGKIRHGMHPVLTMCAANAVIIKDPAGNRKLDKSKATGRIDGMVALAMAFGITLGSQDDQSDIDAFLSSPLKW